LKAEGFFKAEGRGQRAFLRQKPEGRRQKAEGFFKAEARRQRAEGRG